MKKTLTFFLILLLLPVYARATTYYMSATGTAANKAAATGVTHPDNYMSVATHNGQTFSDGDIILISDKGGTYATTKIEPPSSGSSVGITYRKVTEETPTINPKTTIPNNDWTGPDGNGVYSRANTRAEYFYEDGVIIPRANNSSSLTAGTYYQDHGDNTTCYYKPTSGAIGSHTLAAVSNSGNNGVAFLLYNKSYITIDGITMVNCFKGVMVYNDTGNQSHVTVQNCTMNYCYHGIYGQLGNNLTCSYISGINNTFDYSNLCLTFGFLNGGSNSGLTTNYSHLTIRGNILGHLSYAAPGVSWGKAVNGPAAEMSEDHEGISFQDVNNSLIENNTITNGFDKGIFPYLTDGLIPTSSNIIRNNFVNTGDVGIYIGGPSVAGAENNQVYNNILVNCGNVDRINAALYITIPNNPLSGNNTFYNNTLYRNASGNVFGIYLPNNTSGNWIFKNNFIMSSGWHVLKGVSGAGQYTWDYNCYPTDNMLYDGGAKSLATWQSSISGDAHAFIADPLFVNPGSNTAADYKLLSTSPCLGTADHTVATTVTADFEGKRNYNETGGMSIGAYRSFATGTIQLPSNH